MSHGDDHLREPELSRDTDPMAVSKGSPALGRRRVLLFIGLGLVLAGVALIAGMGWARYQRARTCLDSALAGLHALQEKVPAGSAETADLDLSEMGVMLRGLRDDLACLRTEAGGYMALAPMLGWLPRVGEDIASASDLLDMAETLAFAGVLISEELSPLLNEMQWGGATVPGDRGAGLDLAQALSTLEAAQPSLAEAEAQLDRAWELHLVLDERNLSPRLDRLLDLTGRYLPLLRTGVRAAQLAPELLGADGPRTYLILAQNDDERRPTGGWISGLGLITAERGRVSDVSFMDSWAVDNLQVPHAVPPESMFRALWAEIWLFRDANWSPDFPTSARVAEDILQRDQGIAVDGVIAVDQYALQLLVRALAPLEMESSDEAVTGSNVLTFVREAWAEPQTGVTLAGGWGEWVTRRKDFMSELADAMLRKVQDEPEAVDLSQLARALWQGLQERHILVYLHDQEPAALLATQRWDGGIVTTRDDYLQVVDANVGFNKVDPNVRREIAYHIDLSHPERAQAEVVVSYRNDSQREIDTCVQEVESLPSYEQRMQGCYWNYVRIYAPEGARLEAAEQEPIPAGSLLSRYGFTVLGDAGPDAGSVESGKAAFGMLFVLAPGEQRDVRMVWQLPPGTVEEEEDQVHYRLLVQKQSGTPAIPLRLTVSVPSGAQLLSSSPGPAQVAGSLITFALSLEMDQQIDITFGPVNHGEP